MKIVVEVRERNVEWGERRHRPDHVLFCGEKLLFSPDDDDDGPAYCVLEYEGDDTDGTPRLLLSLWTEGV